MPCSILFPFCPSGNSCCTDHQYCTPPPPTSQMPLSLCRQGEFQVPRIAKLGSSQSTTNTFHLIIGSLFLLSIQSTPLAKVASYLKFKQDLALLAQIGCCCCDKNLSSEEQLSFCGQQQKFNKMSKSLVVEVLVCSTWLWSLQVRQH